MFENVNIYSSVAVYVQIENLVLFAIASGELKPGDQLPTVHEVASRLDINPNTVTKAYRDLVVMGYVFTRRGMGVFIEKDIEAKCIKAVRQRIISRVHEVVAEARAAGFTAAAIKDIASKSYACDAGPYGKTPQALQALA